MPFFPLSNVCSTNIRFFFLFKKSEFPIKQKDNPRLFNIPPRDSKEWKLEYNSRTSVERSNKREKIDYKLEDGRHLSTKMWYCRLYAIMMLQHLDAWKMPSRVDLQFNFLRIANT